MLRAVTLEHFRDLAGKEGVLGQVPAFVEASGRLSLLLYKEEIERSLRTPLYGGFQLLGLQDSFDQGCAYVGQVNNFFEPKPYVTAAKFREFCGSQVPLARMPKRVWLDDETFAADIELANYGPATLERATVTWRLAQGKKTVGQGTFGPMNLPVTGLQPVGRVQYPLTGVQVAAKLQLDVAVKGTKIRNQWNIWVYPKSCDTTTPANVTSTNARWRASFGAACSIMRQARHSSLRPKSSWRAIFPRSSASLSLHGCRQKSLPTASTRTILHPRIHTPVIAAAEPAMNNLPPNPSDNCSITNCLLTNDHRQRCPS